MKLSSDYLYDVYNDTDRYKQLTYKVVANVERLQAKLKFDSIAFSGYSGCAMAYPVGMLTGIPLICVRKDKENSHAATLVEGGKDRDHQKYLIIDDFVSSGTTIKRIMDEISKRDESQRQVMQRKCKCVGVLLYTWTKETAETYNTDWLKNKLEVPLFGVESIAFGLECYAEST